MSNTQVDGRSWLRDLAQATPEPRGAIAGKPLHEPLREAGYKPSKPPVRPEFLAFPGSRRAQSDFRAVMNYMAVFMQYSDYAVEPPGSGELGFDVVVEYGHVGLVLYTSRVPVTQDDAAHTAVPGSWWQSVARMLRGAGSLALLFGTGLAVASIILAEPIIPLCSLPVDTLHAALHSGGGARRVEAWRSAYGNLIELATRHAMRPGLSDDADWRFFWNDAAACLARLSLTLPESLLNRGEREFLNYHFSAMGAWPGLYNLPGGAK